MRVRSSRAVLLFAVPASLALALLAGGCPSGDLCAQAPLCDNNRTINCEPDCFSNPCSNGAKFHDCGAGATCEIRPGNLGSERFFRARAVCTVNGSDSCDPATAPAPTCDGLGNITGCSEYHRLTVAACSQAWLFFANAACCAGGGDGGRPDAGPPDGGMSDGGPDSGF